ncbi:MAG: DNA-binding transcriptional regulator [Alphaproteobacteria bacterium]|nr:MAG: DNA-binding transcriptional regulator [Alphaproteobacteria bacterium]
MRHEKATMVLELARRLAASAEGLSTEEMAEQLGVCRRTAERMRDAIAQVFPQMEVLQEGVSKRFRIPRGLDGFFQSPTTDELVELSRAVDTLRDSGHRNRAATLEGLGHKVTSALKAETRRRISPDVEALSRAEVTGIRSGPQPVEDPLLLTGIRKALMGMSQVRFRYIGGSNPGSSRTLVPYGLFFERMNYLVGAEVGSDKPRNWRLDRIEDFEVLNEPGAPPEAFSIADYTARSFGVFHDSVETVKLRFTGNAATEARRWRFHPTQVVTPEDDGSVLVEFETGGMLELAWHLFTWRTEVEILSPAGLREVMVTELRNALMRHHESSATEAVADMVQS